MVTKFYRSVNNDFVDAIIFRHVPPAYETIILAFKILPSASNVLDLLVDVHWQRADADRLWRNADLPLRTQLPQVFLLRVMDRLMWMNCAWKKQVFPLDKRCSYHEHESESSELECQITLGQTRKGHLRHSLSLKYPRRPEELVNTKENEAANDVGPDIKARLMRALPQEYQERDGDLFSDEDL
ncbi:hypothetical protein BDV96DRAFT_403208 [Lophiotrema nucula]|uniref:Uncharacterized protein n=1 Tax=Lophiotrema nucula TaxID=690887 RepID=A0A6A5ZEB0_9PLEO|nr:hypothetical protein BDV96DRAFT_403208 [Lophiotrema nucula]